MNLRIVRIEIKRIEESEDAALSLEESPEEEELSMTDPAPTGGVAGGNDSPARDKKPKAKKSKKNGRKRNKDFLDLLEKWQNMKFEEFTNENPEKKDLDAFRSIV